MPIPRSPALPILRLLLCYAAPGIFDWVDEGSGCKITLNTEPKAFDDAAAACRKQGGQLAAWCAAET